MIGKYDEAILKAIDEIWITQCQPPTLRQLMDKTGCTSTSVIAAALRRMARGGAIFLPETIEGRNYTAPRPVPAWLHYAVQEHVNYSGMWLLNGKIHQSVPSTT